VQAREWVGHAIATALRLDASDKTARARIGSMIKVLLASGGLRLGEEIDAQ
jgi:hypothetical protein